MAAYPIKNAAQLGALMTEINPDVIGVDEAQFFTEEFSGALAVIAKDMDVYVAGLDLDAWARPFGPMPHLLAIADREIGRAHV